MYIDGMAAFSRCCRYTAFANRRMCVQANHSVGGYPELLYEGCIWREREPVSLHRHRLWSDWLEVRFLAEKIPAVATIYRTRGT